MKARCGNPNDPEFHNYGARGIQVCERWRHSFEAFFADMGLRPSLAHTLDRIDNDGSYTPENCRWATKAEQRRNSRQARFLTLDAETLTIGEWSRRIGLSRTAIRQRLRLGWTLRRALSSECLGTNHLRRASAPRSAVERGPHR